jgi:hypothetical protein
MAGKRRNRGKTATAGEWERWQLATSIARMVIEIVQPWLDRFLGGGGPGRLL